MAIALGNYVTVVDYFVTGHVPSRGVVWIYE
jgi:hypothetical protein